MGKHAVSAAVTLRLAPALLMWKSSSPEEPEGPATGVRGGVEPTPASVDRRTVTAPDANHAVSAAVTLRHAPALSVTSGSKGSYPQLKLGVSALGFCEKSARFSSSPIWANTPT